MIITQTPLRISFLGGGTDFPGFYDREHGCVLSSAIDKHIFVIIKGRFDDLIRIGYSSTEVTDRVANVEHDLVREALRMTGIGHGVEVATMADIPSRGSGLGSSSTVSVGLLHAMWNYQGILPTRQQLAEGACEIELGRLGRPIGKQDQYAAAYGGLRFITFSERDVTVERAVADDRIERRFGERLMLFFTGVTRKSADVLTEQRDNIDERRPTLRRMAELTRHGREALQRGDLDSIGELMHEGWIFKQSLASNITNGTINEMYQSSREAGAVGGKISGAGGGGFLLLYCRPENQEAVRAALHGLTELEFHLEPEGSKSVLNSRRR